MADLKALAGFEKSGHFFFNAPVGRGYDDGVVTAIAVIDMLDRNPGKTMAELYADVPKTWGSPTMSPHCADEVKYGVVDKVVQRFQDMHAKGEMIDGKRIVELVTVNGVRVMTEDGTWGPCAPPRTSRSSSSWSRARSRKPACAKCSRARTRCSGPIRRWASTTRRFKAKLV